ncbi:TniQ family protein [Paenibacillus sp. DR312]|uniref:TniQ family protein n=1 Tax=Paenibacillus sp. DR312 TaxID=2871175 RepID=UPI001C95A36D|nr:TniQ family protein [Paenibacillus sp. DR312]QZN75519.1 TniQ family protein [Paenibacillus sp. DR312]
MNFYHNHLCKLPYKVSRLYALSPEGLQTGLKEGILSYITRLAAAHHVCVGDLVKEIISSELNREYMQNDISRGGSRFYQRSSSLNGVGFHSQSIVDLLTTLTTVKELDNLTLLRWQEVICDKYLLKSSKAWCAQCYQEWYTEGTPLYEPLFWSLRDATYCPIHSSLLISLCPNLDCKKKIAPLTRNSVIGFCPHCFTWLGENSNNNNVSNRNELKVSITLFRFISHTESSLDPTIHRSNIQKSFKSLLNFTDGNIAQLASYLLIHRTTVWQYCTGKHIPPLSTILSICDQLNIDLIDFLLGKDSFIGIDFSNPRSRNTRSSNHKTFNHDVISNTLLFYTQCNPPCSLTFVSKKINYSTKSINKNFPLIAKQIKNRFKEFKLNNKKINTKNVYDDIERAVENLRSLGCKPNRRNVERYLQRKGLLLRTEYKHVWEKHVYASSSGTKVVELKIQ